MSLILSPYWREFIAIFDPSLFQALVSEPPVGAALSLFRSLGFRLLEQLELVVRLVKEVGIAVARLTIDAMI